MSDSRGQQPHDSNGSVILRAQGIPVPKNAYLGSSAQVYRDIINLSLLGARAFHGLSCFNFDTTNWIRVAIGIKAANTPCIFVPPNSIATFDNQCFGPIYEDIVAQQKFSRVRAILCNAAGTPVTAGTAATGTFNYDNTGVPVQPADGDTVTVNGNIYEFSNDQSVAAGHFKVDIGATADLSWTNLVTAINLQDSELTASINTGTNIVTLTSNLGGTDGNAQTLSASASLTVAGVVVSGANLSGGGGAASLATFHVW